MIVESISNPQSAVSNPQFPIQHSTMSDTDKALATQLKNIESRSGKSLSELVAFIKSSPLEKHGQLRDAVKSEFGLGYGDANTLVHYAKKIIEGDVAPASDDDVLKNIYSGKKESILPLHEAAMAKIQGLGDFEIAPKKTYLSLRRKKQFATVGPGSKGRLEIGLNMKGLEGTDRLEALPPGRMCQYRVYLHELAEVDEELLEWVKIAYFEAG